MRLAMMVDPDRAFTHGDIFTAGGRLCAITIRTASKLRGLGTSRQVALTINKL